MVSESQTIVERYGKKQKTAEEYYPRTDAEHILYVFKRKHLFRHHLSGLKNKSDWVRMAKI